MQPITAIIFDFDGTLVDTMPLHYEAYRRTLAEAGLELSEPQFYCNIGGTGPETIPKFIDGRKCEWSVQQIHVRKKEIYNELCDSEEIPVLSTAMLLSVFDGRLPMALASSGARPGIERILKRLDWTRHFGAIITGDQGLAGKPDPALFLEAARQLNVEPRNCLVFEDTDAGVAAARAGGMRVFDVRQAVAATALRDWTAESETAAVARNGS